ncbi:MAG TPA: sulfite exporter TauE/SafE family protein [Actinomycetota bacterium]|nr:sulfite exporter TauE/SafE family protein [Actinomycetota bacterium]
MDELLIVFLAGFAASFVDGALGMGFGPASSSILLGTGLSPAAISTTVNLAKVATGITAGVSHWRFHNIDRSLVLRLAIPGSVGALLGVTVLASVDGDRLRPFLTALLLLMAFRILLRFSRALPKSRDGGKLGEAGRLDYDSRGVPVAAVAGGVTNGLIGAWGPVVTPFLLHRGVSPRYAIGCVNTAEVAVAIVASGSLLASVGGGGVNVAVVVAMLAGGVLAAPIAAWTIRFIPARALGVAVGGLLLLTNVRELANYAGLGGIRWAAYGAVIAACSYAAMRPRIQQRRAGEAWLPPVEPAPETGS